MGKKFSLLTGAALLMITTNATAQYQVVPPVPPKADNAQVTPQAPTVNRPSPEYIQVAGTLRVNLTRQWRRYNDEGKFYPNGFADYMMIRAERLRVAGVIMLATGLPIMIAGVVMAVVGAGMLRYQADHSGTPTSASAGLLFGGLAGIVIGVPLSIEGTHCYKRGKKYWLGLAELASYRQRAQAGAPMPVAP